MLQGAQDRTKASVGGFVTEMISINLVNLRRWAGFGPVKDVIDQFAIDLVDGRVISCPHLRNPQTVIVGLAVPDRMYCRPCAQAELLPRLGDARAASECDACGQSTLGLHETTVNVGPVILFGNVCCDCNRSSLKEWAS